MSNSWLVRQRKTDLVELAQHAGLENFESLKKSELELALDEYLTQNSPRFASDPKVAPFYSSRTRAVGSPIKRELPSPVKRDISLPIKKDLDSPMEKPLKVPRRRTTRVIEDAAAPAPERVPDVAPESSEEDSSSGNTTALVQTPARALTERLTLPATPADVAEVVDRSTLAVRTRVASIYKESGFAEATNATRQSLSTVNTVLTIVSIFELWFLRPEVLPDRYAFTIPAVGFLGTKDYPVFVSDLFLLMTTSFWSPAFIWALTSTIIPSFAGYFLNLSVANQSDRRPRNPQSQPDYVVDPLTFSVVKALLSFVVYGQKVTFGGWLNPQSINRIDGAIYGGWKGVLVGTAITGLFSVYDAVLKK